MFNPKDRVIPTEINQYCIPVCYELAGRKVFLRFDDGVDYFVQFLDGRFLLLGRQGEAPTLEGYCCMKSDDLTYFVHIDRQKPVFAPITLVLDYENHLVTRVDSGKATPDNLHWFTMKACFGYIDEPGYAAPAQRHEICRDMVGLKIEWRYNEDVSIYHLYMPNDTVRLGWPQADESTPQGQLQKDHGTDVFEEPVQTIRIKRNRYLVLFCECNMANKDPESGGGGALLMDLDKITDVGMFHTITREGRESYVPVSVFGRLTDQAFPEDTLPSSHAVRYGLDGRQVYPALKE